MKYFLLYCFQQLSETPHNMQQLTFLNRHITMQISLHVTMTFCSSFAYIVYFTTWAATFIEWLRLSWDILLVFSVFSWKSPLIEHTFGLNLTWTLQSLLRRIKPHGGMGNSTLHQIGALLFSWTLLWESLFPLVFQSSGQQKQYSRHSITRTSLFALLHSSQHSYKLLPQNCLIRIHAPQPTMLAP